MCMLTQQAVQCLHQLSASMLVASQHLTEHTVVADFCGQSDTLPYEACCVAHCWGVKEVAHRDPANAQACVSLVASGMLSPASY